MNNIDKALNLINLRIGRISGESAFYESEPWGFDAAALFLNKVVLVDTTFNPYSILHLIQQIENELGRKRSHTEMTYTSREIDIDILFFDDEIVNSETLIIPHPRLQSRKFALIPLAEISPLKVHPLFNKNVGQLLLECPDRLNVRVFSTKTNTNQINTL